MFRTAEEYIAQGEPDRLFEVRFPLFYVVSAAAYVDRYGAAEEYNILKHLPALDCPTLLTYGAMELREQVAFSGIPEEVEKLGPPADRFNLVVIAGADHVYTGASDILGHRISKWVGRLQPS
jgi:hypothetical protein